MSQQHDDEGDDCFLDDQSFIAIQAGQQEAEPMVRTSAPRFTGQIFTNVDAFANINDCTPEQIERLARILEIRGAQPRQIKMRLACFAAAGISAGVNVLEIGAGTGVVARELAKLVGKTGRVVGLDVSDGLLDYARRLGGPEDVPIHYLLGDAYSLDFADNSFDATCAITLLAHIGNLDQVVAEMVRVSRRTVALLDQDYQTLVFENSDTRLTRKILQHGADYNVLDGWCGRKLPGLLVRHRLKNVQCWPFVYSERDSESYLITIAERFVTLAASRGAVTQEEGRVWLQELYDRAVEGTFYASLNYYFAFGQK
jgi:ubiquinone/menaquinone biosynthesis C-methylase UbiE